MPNSSERHYLFWRCSPFFDMQRSVTSWWSSFDVWSSSPSPGCSCCRTCRSSSAEKPSCSSSTPGAWTNWLSATLPRSALPESTSTSSELAHILFAKHQNAKFVKWNPYLVLITATTKRDETKETENKTGGWSNKNERRDKSRRNDLKWSQGQGSLWPQAAVFLPTRSDSLPPTPNHHHRSGFPAWLSFHFYSQATSR